MKNSQLSFLARGMSAIQFVNDLEPAVAQKMALLAKADDEALKNCSHFTGAWHVRLCLNGKQYTLGICNTTNKEMVVRYADAVLFYFWKYRRTSKEMDDRFFNLSSKQAQTDLNENHDLGRLLRLLDDELQANAPLEPVVKAPKVLPPSLRATVPRLEQLMVAMNERQLKNEEWQQKVTALLTGIIERLNTKI